MHDLSIKNFTSPKDVWTYRIENGFILASNPKRKIVKKITKLPNLDTRSRIIHNALVKDALSAPIKIYLDITQKCNLRCLHCLSSSGNSNVEIQYELVRDIFEWSYDRGVFQVKLGGGEPVLHPRFWEIANLANEKNMLVSTSTNGCLVTKEMVNKYKDLGIKVSVSLDGGSKNHNKLRGDGVFEKAIKTLDLLVKAGVHTCIGMTIMNSRRFNNLADVPFLVGLAKEYGILIKIRRAKPCGRATKNSLALTKPDQEFWQMNNWLNEQKQKGVMISLENVLDYNNNVGDKDFKNIFDCGAGTRAMHINPRGRTSPCPFMGFEFDAEVVSCYKDLDSIWTNSKSFCKLRELTNHPNKDCASCPRRERCGGECRAIAYAASGVMNSKDPACPLKYLEDDNI